MQITGKPAHEAAVEIPWLTASPQRWTWQTPLEQWVKQSAQPQAGGLTLRWQGKTLFMPQVAAGVYAWRWGIIVREPTGEEEMPLRFGEVQVGAVRSQAVVLEVRRPPVVANSAGVWNLGVGVYAVTAAWEKARAVLGQETTLIITVAGKGDLERVPAPNLAGLPGWERDAFLIERLPDAAREAGAAREFRYSVRPRRLGAVGPPGLVVRWFDPEAGTVQTRQVKIPPLEVASAAEATARAVAGPLYAEDALKVLHPKWIEYQEKVRLPFDNLWWSRIALWLPVLALGMIVARAWLRRSRPVWWERARRRRAAKVARWRFILTGEDLTPQQAREIVADWLAAVLERPVSAEFDHLQDGLKRAGLEDRLRPLVRAVRAWEFGPAVALQRDEVQATARELFRQVGQAT